MLAGCKFSFVFHFCRAVLFPWFYSDVFSFSIFLVFIFFFTANWLVRSLRLALHGRTLHSQITLLCSQYRCVCRVLNTPLSLRASTCRAPSSSSLFAPSICHLRTLPFLLSLSTRNSDPRSLRKQALSLVPIQHAPSLVAGNSGRFSLVDSSRFVFTHTL